jgi:hypothetical protein
MDTTKFQIAEYLRDMSRQLQTQARTFGLETAEYLLGLVIADLKEIIKTKDKRRHGASPAKKRIAS